MQRWKDLEAERCAPGPPVGKSHRFHQKSSCMGVLSSDARTFTKRYNKASGLFQTMAFLPFSLLCQPPSGSPTGVFKSNVTAQTMNWCRFLT